jgi:hypothetical protein
MPCGAESHYVGRRAIGVPLSRVIGLVAGRLKFRIWQRFSCQLKRLLLDPINIESAPQLPSAHEPRHHIDAKSGILT